MLQIVARYNQTIIPLPNQLFPNFTIFKKRCRENNKHNTENQSDEICPPTKYEFYEETIEARNNNELSFTTMKREIYTDGNLKFKDVQTRRSSAKLKIS